VLWRKLLRELKENIGPNLACMIIIAIGIMSYNAFHMAVDNLDLARNKFYTECRFADGFASIREMPQNLLESLAEVPGIVQVQGNLRKDVKVIMPEWGNNISLRLVGIDIEDPGALNRVIQSLGPGIKDRSQEVLLGKGFMAAHNIKAGDSFYIIINGKKHRLQVAGAGQSPEYIYLLPDEKSFFSDPRTFDVAFIDNETLAALTGQQGIINEIAFRLRPGVSFEEVEGKVREILQPYGLTGLTDAENQLSNFLLNQEIQGVRKMADTLPVLFILLAVFILYIMLKRLVEKQRTQIGTLKAFGYSSAAIMAHYGYYGGAIGLLGGCLGIGAGFYLAGIMTELYGTYFNLPNLLNRYSWQYSLQGLLLAVLPCVAAALAGSGGVLKLWPAEAMQPPAPKAAKRVFLEHFGRFWQSLGILCRMAVRNIFRSPGRSFFITAGVMSVFSLLWIIFSFNLIIDLMLFNEITTAQKYDLKVNLMQVHSFTEVKNALESIEGVLVAEPVLETGVKLRHGSRREEALITGLPTEGRLYQVLDQGRNKVEIPPAGIILSKQLADKLKVQKGARIYLESPYLKDPVQVYVSDIAEQYFGMGNYMSIASLSAVLQAGDVASGCLVKVKGGPEKLQEIEEELLLAQGVAAVENREATLNMYERLMEPTSATLYSMVIVAVVTAFAVIYAAATVALSERQREISSAKVLGMTDQEIIISLAIENGILTISGIICGFPLAKALMLAMKQAYTTDLYTLPAQLAADGFVYSIIALAAALFLALWAVRNKISRLEIVEVLKSRD